MPAIRRQIMVGAAPRKAWAALASAEGLTSWWVDEARLEPRAGGRFWLRSEDEQGEPVEDRGIVHVWRPTSHLELHFDSVGKGPLAGTRLSFQVALVGEESRISIVHQGALLDEPEAHARLDTDWKRSLQALQSLLDGE